MESHTNLIKKHGVPVGLQGVLQDITEFMASEKSLKKAMKELKVLNEKLRVTGELTRHDIRNKLQATINNIFLVKQKLRDDPEASEYMDEIESTCGHVERILHFATTYERLGVEELMNMDVGETIDMAVSLFSDFHGVKVVNNCLGVTILADSLMRQLFYNLIDNSLKHGEKVSQIKVYHEVVKDKQKLIYEDDGVGIPKAEKEKIFKEGYGKETGYGLWLVRKICEVYGWTIRETGKQGKGAQFTITIPKTSKNG